MSKIIQWSGSLGNSIGDLGKKAIIDLAVSLAKGALAVLDKFDQKISQRGAVSAGKGFTLFILNEDIDDLIKILKSLEDSGLLTDDLTKTVKDEKKTRWRISWCFDGCFIDSTYDFFIETTFLIFIDIRK